MNFGHVQTLTTHMQGWECPKCGCVYSPSISKCFTCGPQTLTTTKTTTDRTTTGHRRTETADKEDHVQA